MRNYIYIKIKQATVLFFCGLLSLSVYGQQRDEEKIKNIAIEFGKMNNHTFVSNYLIKTSSTMLFPDKNLHQGEEAFYICKPIDRKGFVIVSGDERMPKILGYSYTNDFDTENTPPNVKYWLSGYVDTYMALDKSSADTNLQELSDDIKPEGVDPLLGDVQWGQGEPYNNQCPEYQKNRCVTGCVATAMAQVMKYYSYPKTAKGSKNYVTRSHSIHVIKDLSDIEFKWDLMLPKYSDNYSVENADAIATLMYCCGASVEMDYSPDGSGAYQSDLLGGYIQNFSYDSDAAVLFRNYCSESDWHHLLINELNKRRPVNYGGSNRSDGGHSFVLDGYKVSVDNIYPDYHINWGWEGRCDGYYQLSSLHPKENGENYTQAGFIEGQQMTIGIIPEDNQDDGNYYICTSNIRTSSTTVKPGGKIRIYTSGLYNMSYKKFDGKVTVGLFNQDEEMVATIGSQSLQNLYLLEGVENLSLDILIPDDFAEGTYTVRFLVQSEKNKTWINIYSASYANLTISAEEQIVHEEGEPALLGCSDVEFVKVEDQSDICVRLYEITSLREKAFVGDLFMVLADKFGKPLATISDVVHPEELGYLDVMKEPLSLHGHISDKWGDGEYKLYFGVKHIEEENFSYIKSYDWTVLGKAPSELYFDVKKADGKVKVNGHTYDCETTAISILQKQKDTERGIIYNISGQLTNRLCNGINIVRMSDGTYKKVFIK